MFANAYKWVKKCEKCKLFTKKSKLVALPLRLVIIKEPFNQWGLDFIRPLYLSIGHTHFKTTIDYFIKWVDAAPVKKTTSKVVSKFLMENILVQFCIPKKIVTNNAQIFLLKGNTFFILYKRNLPFSFI